MSKYYENMPEDFKKAVETIKQYCQNEDCNEKNCKDCKYPLSVIRCGDKAEIGTEKRKPCINREDGCEEWAGCPCVYYKAECEDD